MHTPVVRVGRLRVGITLMTRKPHAFDWWLRYHRALGISHVFVHVEDTPELLELLSSAEFEGFVTVTTGSDNSLDTHNPKARGLGKLGGRTGEATTEHWGLILQHPPVVRVQ